MYSYVRITELTFIVQFRHTRRLMHARTNHEITNVATMPISAIMKSMQEIVLYGNVDENDVRWILEQVLTSN